MIECTSLCVVLNIGTSAQLSVVAEQTRNDVILDDISSYPALHLLPYFNDCSLIVAAALTGEKHPFINIVFSNLRIIDDI
jgi:hypothetical protein